MSIFKCKMCGGTLNIGEGLTVIECEYCGTKQTLPKLDDDKRANLYDRANHFRRNNEFDKAMGIYEQILSEDNSDSEAYWSLVLCRYGIEYVEDPSTKKRVPTVNRAQFTSIFDDDNYKSALQYADSSQRIIYENEAKAINEIQKGILAISQKEEPFDIFICYKETDNGGRRTPDSVLATDLYHQLNNEGFKVFFARITLEDKLGSAYEPYIFAALNSAKVMVVLGTKPEYFNAVWVKNEWSRYLSLIKSGAKKMLIPAYRDMDPYDLPEQFSHLQAQDMSKLGFMQDLIRGIKKITQTDEPKQTVIKETVVQSGNTNIAPLLKRAFMFLEDGDWERADDFCEQVLNIDPECAEAYLGKLMAELKVRKREKLKDCAELFDANSNFKKAVRFGDDKLKTELNGCIDHIKTRNENARLEGIYVKATNMMSTAKSEGAYGEASQLFESIGNYKDSATLAKECIYLGAKHIISFAKTEGTYIKSAQIFESLGNYKDSSTLAKEYAEKAEEARKNAIYSLGKGNMSENKVSNYETAIGLFEQISGWRDADEMVAVCRQKIEELKAKAEADRIERERVEKAAQLERERRAKRNKKIVIIATSIICVVIAFVILLNTVIIPNGKYKDAIALMNDGKYTEAIAIFEKLDGYKDSKNKITECKYNKAVSLMDDGKYTEAISAFEKLDGYKDSKNKITECKYNKAVSLIDDGKYTEAISAFEKLDGYKDSNSKIEECNTAILDGKYNEAVSLVDEDVTKAYEALIALDGYKDSEDKAESIYAKYKIEKIKTAKVGYYVFFGTYEQDNNTSNGKEDIEWQVLETKDGKALVISKYALDCKPYNEELEDVTWETSTLRKWLNNDFLNSAFSSDEKAFIPTVTVSSDKNPDYGTNPGNATQDKVFLLSINEVNKYFSSDSARECKPTAYVDENGVYVYYNGNCCWWLRSPGDSQYNAAYVNYFGHVLEGGLNVFYDNRAVRPALWINLES